MPWFDIDYNKDKNSLTIDLSKRRPCTMDALTCSKRYIDRLVKEYPAPYTVFASGGVDSQAAILAWMHSGHPFDVVSVRYDHNLNEHDISKLIPFQEKYKVNIRYIDFSLTEFVENRLKEYVYKYNCTSPQICTHMAISELVPEGTVIFSGTPVSILDHPELVPELFSLYNYKNLTRQNFIPMFLLEDEDLTSAFITAQRQIAAKAKGGPYALKFKMYWQAGLDVLPQIDKLTGFEEAKKYYNKFPKLVTRWEKLKWSHMQSHCVFDIAFRYRWIDDLGNTPRLKCLI